MAFISTKKYATNAISVEMYAPSALTYHSILGTVITGAFIACIAILCALHRP